MPASYRRGAFGGLLIVMLWLLVLSGANAQDDLATQVLQRINGARADAGLPQLTRNAQLDAAAQGHADDLMQHGARLGHGGSDGSTFRQRIARAGFGGENVGENWAGYRSLDKIMDFWLNDAPHRRNILNRGYSEIGIGVAVRSNGGAIVVTDFGGQKTAAAPPQVQPAAAAPQKARPTKAPVKPKANATAIPPTRKPTRIPTTEPTALPTKAVAVVQVAIVQPSTTTSQKPPAASGKASRVVLSGDARAVLGAGESSGDATRMTFGGALSLGGALLLGVAVVGQQRRFRRKRYYS